MFFLINLDLLYFIIRTLKGTYAFVIDPDANRWFYTFLDSYEPVLMWIYGHDIICVTLHEELFSCVDVTTNQDASCGIVDFIIFEDEVWVVKWGEWKCIREFQEWLWGEDSHCWFGFIDWWWDIISSLGISIWLFICLSVIISSYYFDRLITFNNTIRKLFWWLNF